LANKIKKTEERNSGQAILIKELEDVIDELTA